MKRLLLVVGPILSIAGAVGLIMFGDALVGIMDGVLTYRFVNPPEPLPASLVSVKWAAFSGMALTLGLAISCIGTVIRDSQKTISLAGRLLASVAGILLVFGTMSLLWGVLGAKRAFIIIATSAMTPKPENVQEMVEASSPMFMTGSAILLIGAAVLLVAGQVGLQAKPPQAIETHSVFGVLAAIGSVLLGVVLSLLFIGILLHGNALESFFIHTAIIPKASELARHLVGILNKSLLAFIGVGCQGTMHILAAAFAPSAKQDAASND